MEDNYEWHCILCEKAMKIGEHDHHGCLAEALWPNIEGGTFAMDFGWPSKYDDQNFNNNTREWQGCICDDCFEEKKHLMRHVKVIPQRDKWEAIDKEEQ